MAAIPSEANIPEENKLRESESIKQLFNQIRKMPELTKQARAVDQVLLNRLKELRSTASTIISQFYEQKKVILQRFDKWIMPIAHEVLDSLLKDANELKNKLDSQLNHLEQVTPGEWDEQAKHWAQLYAKWNDRNALVEKILEVVADRTKELIDKDIQVIQDYQMQSLAMCKEAEAVKSLEERLSHAIEEPMKQLISLRNKPKDHTSLQQASEWVSKLQEKRESYFDQLLMKIDHIMKDVVQIEERNDWTSFLEIESELIFMERELHHINVQISDIQKVEEEEKQFTLARLEGLIEHIDQLNEQFLPMILQMRVKALKTGISHAMTFLI